MIEMSSVSSADDVRFSSTHAVGLNPSAAMHPRSSRFAKLIRAGFPVGPLGMATIKTIRSGKCSARSLPLSSPKVRSSRKFVVLSGLTTTATPTHSPVAVGEVVAVQSSVKGYWRERGERETREIQGKRATEKEKERREERRQSLLLSYIV